MDLETTVVLGQMDRGDWIPSESFNRSLFLVKPNIVAGTFYWIVQSSGSGFQYASVGSAHVIQLIDKDASI